MGRGPVASTPPARTRATEDSPQGLEVPGPGSARLEPTLVPGAGDLLHTLKNSFIYSFERQQEREREALPSAGSLLSGLATLRGHRHYGSFPHVHGLPAQPPAGPGSPGQAGRWGLQAQEQPSLVDSTASLRTSVEALPHIQCWDPELCSRRASLPPQGPSHCRR